MKILEIGVRKMGSKSFNYENNLYVNGELVCTATQEFIFDEACNINDSDYEKFKELLNKEIELLFIDTSYIYLFSLILSLLNLKEINKNG